MAKGDGRHTRTQAERRAATTGALIAAARALFAERGYAGASREEIVEAAGVTRGALYHHYASKQDLFAAVYEAVEGDLCEAVLVAAASAGTDDPVEQLRAGAMAFLDAAATPEVRRILLIDAPAVLPVELRRQFAEQYGLGIVRTALRAVDDAGRLAVQPVDQLAPVMLAALHEAALSIADGEDPAAMRVVVDGVIDRLTLTR
jgi:AcrR family transcriptional regulator